MTEHERAETLAMCAAVIEQSAQCIAVAVRLRDIITTPGRPTLTVVRPQRQ